MNIRRSVRRGALVLTVLALTALAPLGAQADHCKYSSMKISLGSALEPHPDARVAVPASIHPFPTCSADWAAPQETVDTRLIYPSSTHVSPGFLQDLGAGTPTIQAVLNGMGFVNRTVTLTRTQFGGSFLYSGPYVKIPNGPATSGGKITVRISNTGDTSTYKTPS